jgi:predicted glycosyltransferase
MNRRDDHAASGNSHIVAARNAGSGCRKIRVALYSHDTMGLGHMRRNLLLAQTLARSASRPVILMIAGAREAGALPLPAGVDCLTLPALGKDKHGRSCSRHLNMPASDLTALRSRIIAGALEAFAPDALIVDKVPRGAGHELDLALKSIKERGATRCVLGLRDILDDAKSVRREWQESATDETIKRYYDAVWVYGDPAVYDPVREYGFSAEVAARVRFTGYLDQRSRLDGQELENPVERLNLPAGRIVLCQVGGGQDGAALAEAFLHARLPEDAVGVLLTGPYLPRDVRERLLRGAARRPRFRVIEFLAEPSRLLSLADRVIAMGGYNTVNEILSFHKTALIVPRVFPRLEQRIRAERLSDLNLLDMLLPHELSPQALTEWLHRDIPPRPSVHACFDWQGLNNLPRLLDDLLAASLDARQPFPEWENLAQCDLLETSASATW